jgi:hypothetical protein
MKKILVAAILGMVATASVMAQGRVWLMNYDEASPGGQVLGVNGTTPIASGQGFTAGLYFQLGHGQTFVDPTGFAVPGGGWTLGTGAFSTANFIGSGFFQGLGDFSVPGTSATAAANISIIVVAYNGADYASSTIRGHSAAFNWATVANTDAASALSAMPGFQVYAVPEPSTFALAGLGLASLLIFRRRK